MDQIQQDTFDLSFSVRGDLQDDDNIIRLLLKYEDETISLPVIEFAVLNPNWYSFNNLKKEQHDQEYEGIKRCVKKCGNHQQTHDNYMATMKTNEQLSRGVVSLRSKDHM